MKAQSYNKAVLLERVRANRSQHSTDYEEARKGYKQLREERISKLRIHLSQETGKRAVDAISEAMNDIYQLPRAESHVKDYDRVIDILELSSGEEVELEELEFDQYVRDEWSWKAAAAATTQFYAANAR
jgi:hypothetical protein